MDSNLILLAQLGLDEEGGNLGTMVTLQLDNLSTILILNNITITGKIFLKSLQDLLGIDILGQPFNSGQGLASISLMKTNI